MLSSILVCAHIVQCPYCPVSLCVLVLSSILAHNVQYPCMCSYCPVSLYVLILSSVHIVQCAHSVQYPYVHSYCPVSLCVLILSSVHMCAHIVQCPYVHSYCPVSLCVLILSSVHMCAHIVQYAHVCSECPVSLGRKLDSLVCFQQVRWSQFATVTRHQLPGGHFQAPSRLCLVSAGTDTGKK